MKKLLNILAAVALAAGLFILGSVGATTPTTSESAPDPEPAAAPAPDTAPAPQAESANAHKDILGEHAPDFELQSTNGETIKLSELEGKVVVLDFWAVWCGPCRDSMPFFESLQNEHEDEGLVVIGLHVDDRMPPVEEVNEYLEEVGARYTNLVSTFDVDNAFDIVAMPTTYLVDRNGVLKKRHIGFNPSRTPARLTEDVEALLAE